MGTVSRFLVCSSCGMIDGSKGTTRGMLLADKMESASLPIIRVDCMSACSQHCVIALDGDNKKTCVLSNLKPNSPTVEALATLLDLYDNSTDGDVSWKDRPALLKNSILVKIPNSDSL